MATHRINKINEQLQREISLIIQQKMKNDRFKKEGLSITHVKSTPDLKTATVYVSYWGDASEHNEVIEQLNLAKGFIRSSLGKVLSYRCVPALTFKIDDSVEYGIHIEKLLAEIKNESVIDDEAGSN